MATVTTDAAPKKIAAANRMRFLFDHAIDSFGKALMIDYELLIPLVFCGGLVLTRKCALNGMYDSSVSLLLVVMLSPSGKNRENAPKRV
jgi:hypothetical protein